MDLTTGPHSLAQLTQSMNHHSELVLICAKDAELARDPEGCPAPSGGHFSLVGSWAMGFFAGDLEGQSIYLDFPFSSYYLPGP